MICFVAAEKPRSVNAKSKPKYQERVKRACLAGVPGLEWLEGDLYGVIYYFAARPTDIDADNMSKPILDALREVAFEDDQAIRHRTAGIIQLGDYGFDTIDLSTVPDAVAEDLIDMIGTEEDILYIEVGPLDIDMFKLGRTR